MQDFDLLHGLLMARMARALPGCVLQVAEVLPAESWSALVLEGRLGVVVRHRPLPRKLRRKDGGASWRFPFTPDQLDRLRRLGGTAPVALALVCGRRIAGRAELCLLAPDEVGRALDTVSFLAQGITVLALPRKELWISSRGRTRLKVPRRTVKEWLEASQGGGMKPPRTPAGG